jgi:hypothetical protein
LALASLKATPGVGSTDDIVEGAPDNGFESDHQSIDDDDFDSSGDDAINNPSGESAAPTRRDRHQSSQVRSSKVADLAMSQVFDFSTPVNKKAKYLPAPSLGDPKRPVRERMSGASRIANAIQQLSSSAAPTVHERAISVLRHIL